MSMGSARVRLARLSASLGVSLALFATNVAMAYEEPAFEVVGTHDGFELRRYAPMLVAETDMPGGRDAGGNAAFRRLFDYISGNNRSRQKIEMTVPVVMGPASEKIDMTVPVLTQPGTGGSSTMQFVLPSRWTLESAPQPVDPAVRLRQLPPQWLAARRYSGLTGESNFRAETDALRQSLAAASLAATGPAQMAVYDGPFTLWFLRRNEVLIPAAPPPAR